MNKVKKRRKKAKFERNIRNIMQQYFEQIDYYSRVSFLSIEKKEKIVTVRMLHPYGEFILYFNDDETKVKIEDKYGTFD
jgi:ABC-type uncharacterized transport system ATPase subunit